MTDFGRISQERRSGDEGFRDGVEELGFDLLSFWRWSASDIVSNATRGVLAEYLVARAIGAVGVADGVRDEWATYDLLCPPDIKVEVKSAAYLQSWYQKELSYISFGCGKTLGWDPETNQGGTESRRHADVYVFALLAHKDQATLDPLDVSQWQFYVVPTAELDQRKRSQYSITLPSLRGLGKEPVGYSELGRAIGAAAAFHRAAVAANAEKAVRS